MVNLKPPRYATHGRKMDVLHGRLFLNQTTQARADAAAASFSLFCNCTNVDLGILNLDPRTKMPVSRARLPA